MNTNYYQLKMEEMLHDNQTYNFNDDRKILNKIGKLIKGQGTSLTDKEGGYLTNFDYKTS